MRVTLILLLVWTLEWVQPAPEVVNKALTPKTKSCTNKCCHYGEDDIPTRKRAVVKELTTINDN